MNRHSAATLLLAIVIVALAISVWRLNGEINDLQDTSVSTAASRDRSTQSQLDAITRNIWRLEQDLPFWR